MVLVDECLPFPAIKGDESSAAPGPVDARFLWHLGVGAGHIAKIKKGFLRDSLLKP
jgi:hypothetical protein